MVLTKLRMLIQTGYVYLLHSRVEREISNLIDVEYIFGIPPVQCISNILQYVTTVYILSVVADANVVNL
jgi:hypothetical protein